MELVNGFDPLPVSSYDETSFGFQTIKKTLLDQFPQVTVAPGKIRNRRGSGICLICPLWCWGKGGDPVFGMIFLGNMFTFLWHSIQHTNLSYSNVQVSASGTQTAATTLTWPRTSIALHLPGSDQGTPRGTTHCSWSTGYSVEKSSLYQVLNVVIVTGYVLYNIRYLSMACWGWGDCSSTALLLNGRLKLQSYDLAMWHGWTI